MIKIFLPGLLHLYADLYADTDVDSDRDALKITQFKFYLSN